MTSDNWNMGVQSSTACVLSEWTISQRNGVGLVTQPWLRLAKYDKLKWWRCGASLSGSWSRERHTGEEAKRGLWPSETLDVQANKPTMVTINIDVRCCVLMDPMSSVRILL